MSTLTLNIAIEKYTKQVASLVGQIKHCREALATDLANWERKEYQAVLDSKLDELSETKDHLEYLQDQAEGYDDDLFEVPAKNLL